MHRDKILPFPIIAFIAWIFSVQVPLLFPSVCLAGVFNLPRFVTPGEFALGLEPEVILTSGAGIGFSAHYTQGLNELVNLRATIGTGTDPRAFRAGGGLIWDFFPDMEGQPGIGLGTQVLYVRVPEGGQLEVTGIPYLHKSFGAKGSEVEPFLALPVGIAFINGTYKGLASASAGVIIQGSENFRFILEFGLAIANTESSFSGGLVYYH